MYDRYSLCLEAAEFIKNVELKINTHEFWTARFDFPAHTSCCHEPDPSGEDGFDVSLVHTARSCPATTLTLEAAFDGVRNGGKLL